MLRKWEPGWYNEDVRLLEGEISVLVVHSSVLFLYIVNLAV